MLKNNMLFFYDTVKREESNDATLRNLKYALCTQANVVPTGNSQYESTQACCKLYLGDSPGLN